ncbi:MAG: Alpha/beta hydrolase [Devosia sp.]|uniref:alpha/beta hydrolase n=1 Tax=Devosia sp. TaxID=1871048 RepID=UPI0026369F93|nr:alpha/beta hydrolase [Devosia sp.]MDB5538723.1 Alpha/beta hydrolase [Devosia sp.]
MESIGYVEVGEGAEARSIATIRREGAAPGIFWLGGYRSDMTGSKAMALDALGAEKGLAVTRLDYSGHGQSGGAFLDGTISRWLEEALAVFALTTGPQVVVGSSMGGWLALLLAREMKRQGSDRVKALVLIAPAVDMTEELMLGQFTKKEKKALKETGMILQPSDYSDQPYPITARLIEDGRKHLMFGKGIDVGAPVTILQGGRDPDVPRDHALKLVQHLLTDPVTFTLVPDGDHRLSREQDLELLQAAVARELTVPPEQLVLEL